MVKTPLNTFLMYGLVGLAIAGGVITVSHVTSTLVPVFPKYGQLSIDLVLSPSTTDQLGSHVSYAPLNDYARVQENDTLRVTTDTRVNAQTTTNVLVGFHIACSATANGSSSGHSECIVTPSAENED